MKSMNGDIQHGPKEGEEGFEDHEDHSNSLPISRPIKEGPSHQQKAWKIMESHPKDQIVGDMS